jgi:hypothetical protein
MVRHHGHSGRQDRLRFANSGASPCSWLNRTEASCRRTLSSGYAIIPRSRFSTAQVTANRKLPASGSASTASLSLFDPSGEFIGPNGDGDPSHVQISAKYTYGHENAKATGENVTAQFTNTPVPEPSSIVLATFAALLDLAVAFRHAQPTG